MVNACMCGEHPFVEMLATLNELVYARLSSDPTIVFECINDESDEYFGTNVVLVEHGDCCYRKAMFDHLVIWLAMGIKHAQEKENSDVRVGCIGFFQDLEAAEETYKVFHKLRVIQV